MPRVVFWAMVVGFVVGVFRMLVDTPVTLGLFGTMRRRSKGYPEGSFLWIVNNINFQYFSILITLVSAIVMVVVSYMTAAPEYEQIKSLTFGTPPPRTAPRPEPVGTGEKCGSPWCWRSSWAHICISAAKGWVTSASRAVLARRQFRA